MNGKTREIQELSEDDKKFLKKKMDEEMKRLRENFSKSTAGYCVASYILGLGDRHPDNIMIDYVDGFFLHIDFGHFLGNVKQKLGVKRERDPFVLTPEIAYFINNGRSFKVPWNQRIFKKKPAKAQSSFKSNQTLNTETYLEENESYGSEFQTEDYGDESEEYSLEQEPMDNINGTVQSYSVID